MNTITKWLASTSAETTIERTAFVSIFLIVLGTLIAILAASIYLLFGVSTGFVADKAAAVFLLGIGGIVVAGAIAMTRSIVDG